ncbi:D-alanyl-D-alanine carboxypeptidase [Streptomyces olivochromogenes]|uniref:D-alanyl-D-alanine carboxypeptidase n=1 Tax=Streptomyces olivochromogenes TaxID=1963 RepID=UPI001F195959|nr:D-alanyl-D-alanine carboxypeptidase [Streptomyces olivochromogenes]
MAGESPDRSKQRESSAEPTSGSAGPVPEARDPRLAVARESDSGGTTDTATKVLSVREVTAAADTDSPDPKDDARLRAAVAAWVRSGEGGEESDADEADEAAEAAPNAEDDTADSKADAEANGTSESTASPKSAAEPEADAKADAAPETEEKDDAETADDDSAKADADAKTDAADAPEPKADAAPDTDAAAKTDATADKAATQKTEAAETEDENGAEDRAPKAEAAPADTDEDRAEADAPVDAGSASKAEAAPADTDEGGDEAEAEAEDPAPKADAPADATPSSEKDANPKDTATRKPVADPRAADGEDDPQGPPAADDETRAPKADAPADATPSSEKDANPKDTATRKPAADPRAADGEDDPQGPPAADDETRTGGAGGNAAADGGAKAVDQPTAVFKAVRPKPQVDQPTTMLKLGDTKKPLAPKTPASTPNAPASDPERTSRFVALKPLDDQATRNKPAPAAADGTAVIPQVGPERTTQQPLPPKPPLDLLAELTNTPPPPETPVRTLVRRVKIWTPVAVLLAIVFAVVQNLRPLPEPTLDLTAKDSFTFDGGKVDIPWPAKGQAALDVQGIGTFGSSGDQKPVPIASVAKVMTAYLILRDHPLKSGEDGPKIKIDKPAEEQSDAGKESTVPVTAGDSISEREALQAILLPSANNVARLLARWDSGSEKAFVTKMNATAKKLGMTNTTYTDPSGLTDSTVSTAVDQVKLAKKAMEQPAFREVAAMMSYVDYKGHKRDNYNRLVGYNNVVGIKTGTTTSALGNLVFAAKQTVNGETRTIIGAAMRQPAGGSDNTIISGVLEAGDKLIRAAQGSLKSAKILKKGDVVGYVDDGLGGRTPVVLTKDLPAVGWAGLKVTLSFTADKVPHTAKAGTKVGTLTVGDGSSGAVGVPVALQKDLTEPGFAAKLTRIT